MQIQPKKKIKFLGHVFTNEGICNDPEKMKAIHEFPEAKGITQLIRFLGMINHTSEIH